MGPATLSRMSVGPILDSDCMWALVGLGVYWTVLAVLGIAFYVMWGD